MSLLVDNALELVRQFSAVATSDPLSGVLIIVGAILTGVSVGVFGSLTLGAVLSPLSGGKY